MLIRYYRGYVGTERLREMTKTDHNGVTAYHMIETLKKLGFNARGIKIELASINTFPSIAHVTIDNAYNHYVVIYDINKKKQEIIIADPAKKIVKMSLNEFNKIYNNVIIEAIPLRKIPVMREYKISKFIVKTLKEETLRILLIIFYSIIITILSIASSFYLQSLLNNKNIMFTVLIYFIVIEFSLTIFGYLRNRFLIKINNKLDYKIHMDSIKDVITLPYNYFKSRTTGEIITRINDIDSVKNMISSMIIILFVDTILIFLSGIVLYKINNIMFFITLPVIIIYASLAIIFHRLFKDKIEIIKEEKEEVNSLIIESINGIETIKGLNLEEKFINKIDKLYLKYIDSYIKLDRLVNKETVLKELLNGISMLLIMFIGMNLIKKDIILLGSLFTFSNVFMYFLEPIRNIVDLNIDIGESLNIIRRILEINTIKEENGNIEVDRVYNIKIKNLSYSHNDINYNLKDIDLCINQNEKIMLIGKSGSGKSSLLKIMKKYYKIKDNQIYINDIDINTINKVPIAYISQNEILFTGTLLDNLKLNRDIEDNMIDKVMEECYIKDIIKPTDLIEENGFNLSGGEKQRIILGRTLLSHPSFLIIDEALNQVDINMERKILKNILKNKDITIIYVSHRTNNMDLFDRVITMENGKIKDDLRREE